MAIAAVRGRNSGAGGGIPHRDRRIVRADPHRARRRKLGSACASDIEVDRESERRERLCPRCSRSADNGTNCDTALQSLKKLVPERQRPVREEGKKCSPIPQDARDRRYRDDRNERVRRCANQGRVGTSFRFQTAERGRCPVSGFPGSAWLNQKHAYWTKANPLLERSTGPDMSRISKKQKKPFRNRCFPALGLPVWVGALSAGPDYRQLCSPQ